MAADRSNWNQQTVYQALKITVWYINKDGIAGAGNTILLLNDGKEHSIEVHLPLQP